MTKRRPLTDVEKQEKREAQILRVLNRRLREPNAGEVMLRYHHTSNLRFVSDEGRGE